MNSETIDHFISLVKQHGTDCWFTFPVSRLLPTKYQTPEIEYEKSSETLDVWFDSGVTWNGVLSQNQIFPADLYLEGSDQHRGWFQTSLITSAFMNQKSPFKNLITHGFVLDEFGKKMSKSLGNVVDPLQLIFGENKKAAFGLNVLRMWAAHTDYTSDLLIGDFILKKVQDFTKKARNTLRYCLANLQDYNHQQDQIVYEDLREVPLDEISFSGN